MLLHLLTLSNQTQLGIFSASQQRNHNTHAGILPARNFVFKPIVTSWPRKNRELSGPWSIYPIDVRFHFKPRKNTSTKPSGHGSIRTLHPVLLRGRFFDRGSR